MNHPNATLVPVSRNVIRDSCDNCIKVSQEKVEKLCAKKLKVHEDQIVEAMKPFWIFRGRSRKRAEKYINDTLNGFWLRPYRLDCLIDDECCRIRKARALLSSLEIATSDPFLSLEDAAFISRWLPEATSPSCSTS